MDSILVEIKNLSREFKMGDETVRALNDISFTIKSGEFITIMGSSGSGKTTLLNILGCLDKPTSGAYFLDRINVGALSKNELAKLRNKKLGFIFQSYNLLARTTALENVELPLLYNSEISSKERREKAMNALEAVNLSDRIHYLPNQLSGGQQQRVAIARALVNDPIVILADEATGNLDSRTSYGIMMLMQELNAVHGKTIVFITHEPDIASFSKRTILLRDGKVINDTINDRIRSAKTVLQNMPINTELASILK
ncbi:ABC transporter ATP-binding protein [Flavobacterium psychrotolerans]|uniref:ABC transporter ATP-binding protein n=1 Tax=Flavobacterium psychrotolerans TaxID=2169410 RepID=A0A2U1JGX3_9FLAO|nr:ABC transporter ATP-binding protein [Flavobacterium psychrotolerans]PWA04400.1 ABC transporter ATP-binding protein [Flavobacterium psychrotolerans]